MGMIPFWRFPSDAATASASTTAGAGYAPANVQKQTLQKNWKSQAGAIIDYVDFDFGTAVDVDTFAVFGHDFLEADVLKVRLSSVSDFTSDVVDESLTWHEGYLFKTFATLTYRYMRMSINKVADTTARSIGRIVGGTSIELELSLKTPGDQTGPGRTTSTKQTTSGGQQYGNLGISIDILRGSIPGLDADDIAELNDLQRTYQTVTPFVTVIRAGLSNEFAIYGTLDSMQTPKYVTPDLQEIDWRMTEQK